MGAAIQGHAEELGYSIVRVLHDGWTVVTADESLSAHVEHTVAATDDGPRVLTAA